MNYLRNFYVPFLILFFVGTGKADVTIINQVTYGGFGMFFSCDDETWIGPLNPGDSASCPSTNYTYITYCQLSSVTCPTHTIIKYRPSKTRYNAYYAIRFKQHHKNITYIVSNAKRGKISNQHIPIRIKK